MPPPDSALLSPLLPCRLEARGLSRLVSSSYVKKYITYGKGYYWGNLDSCITKAVEDERRELDKEARRAELLAR